VSESNEIRLIKALIEALGFDVKCELRQQREVKTLMGHNHHHSFSASTFTEKAQFDYKLTRRESK